MNSFRDKKVALLGWGINGRDVYNYLLKHQAKITVFDVKNLKDLDFSGVNPKSFSLKTGPDYLKGGLVDFDYIFRAPGIYRYNPVILEAEKKGASVTSAVNLFFDICPGNIIGVTGTKGKGTTSTLIYEILKNAGRDVYLAGNIGVAMLELIPKLNSNSWIVLELSSFQLIDLAKSPQIAVVLNITEDHMDWHKDRDEYIEAKKNIVRNQLSDNFSVIAYDYPDSKKFAALTKGKSYYFSNTQKTKGSYVINNKIYLSVDKEILIGETGDLLLRGKHNLENVSAAICASYLAGAGVDEIKRAVYSFTGLEHRLELVGTVNSVAFYNDSFSTNPQTTAAAVDSFEENITLILGGSDKGLNYDVLSEHITRTKKVKTIILIGFIAEVIKKSLHKAKYDGKIIHLKNTNMKDIVMECYKNTPKGGVVLLSPGTASFDMFLNYKQRGNEFKIAVRGLNH